MKSVDFNARKQLKTALFTGRIVLVNGKIPENRLKMLKVIPLNEEHLEDVALLVSNRYKLLCKQEPHLPHRYSEVDNLLPLLGNTLNASGAGVAAICGERLVGFLTGWQMPSFRGERSTYSPEWANVAELEDSLHIYEEMYSHLAKIWVADQYLAHYISLFPNDIPALSAWNWMGFGMIAVDGLRGLDSIQGENVDVDIRRAGLQDIEQVMELHEALWLSNLTFQEGSGQVTWLPRK